MLPYLKRSRVKPKPLTDEERRLSLELRRDVEVLATDIGPRNVYKPDRYALAEQFLTRVLEQRGYSVERHTVVAQTEFGPLEVNNLIVEVRGHVHPDRVLVVGAHYDSVQGCPAANDNGTGVAGVLAVARAIAGSSPGCTIRCVLFVNEEPPFFNMNDMGSQHYARMCRKRGDNIVGMVCLETIGYYSTERGSQRWPHHALSLVLPDIGDFIVFAGPTQAKSFIRQAARAFARERSMSLLAAAVPDSIGEVNLSDHRGFNEVGYPGFMVTDTAPFRYAHYHLPTDTPDKLDFDMMARTMRGVIGMVKALAND